MPQKAFKQMKMLHSRKKKKKRRKNKKTKTKNKNRFYLYLPMMAMSQQRPFCSVLKVAGDEGRLD